MSDAVQIDDAGVGSLTTTTPDFAVDWLDRTPDDPPALPAPAEAEPYQGAAPAATLARSLRGLDWFSFFLADIQTGFGPFVAVYLTAHAWPQLDIGLVLTVGGLVALMFQMPGGALVDAVRSHRMVASLAIGAICISALSLAIWPVFPIVVAGRVLQAGASCVLGPVIAAMSLNLVGHAALGERLGRNARFASIGSGVAAAAMGACGQLLSSQAVFFFTAAMVLPALLALGRIRAGAADPSTPRTPRARARRRAASASVLSIVLDRRFLLFAACVLMFHLANAALLPLMGSVMVMHASRWAVTVTALCMIVPQVVVAGMSPWVGRKTDSWGRRPLMILCFVALALRCLLFSLTNANDIVVAGQVLDGISAATLGVLFPLVIADVTQGTGRFNLALGVAGTAVGLGASLSTTLAGFALDRFGSHTTLFGFTGVAVAGLAFVLLLMPETRPQPLEAEDDAAAQDLPPNTRTSFGRGIAASISSAYTAR